MFFKGEFSYSQWREKRQLSVGSNEKIKEFVLESKDVKLRTVMINNHEP